MSSSRENGNSSLEGNAPRSTLQQRETWKPEAAVPGPAQTDLSPEAPLVESSRHPPINCPPPSVRGPIKEFSESADSWAALGITASTLPPSSQNPRAASPAMAVPPAATHDSESLARLFELALLQEGVVRPLLSPPPAKPERSTQATPDASFGLVTPASPTATTPAAPLVSAGSGANRTLAADGSASAAPIAIPDTEPNAESNRTPTPTPTTTQVAAPAIVPHIALPESSPSPASRPGSADWAPESASQKRRRLKEGTWDAIVARARVDRSERESEPEDDAGPLSSRAGATPAIADAWKRREVVREETSAQRAARLFDEGLSLLRGGDDAGAFDAWSEAVRLDEDKRVYRTNLRKLARKLGRVLEE